MSAMATPFSYLADIARRSKALAKGLPAQEEAIELWSGIGFTLAGAKYVAPMGEVTEILHIPRFTQIPGVKPWMYGVANVRGRLLPIMDLGLFFGLPQQSVSNREKRVLVVENGDIFSGLAVDNVQGMQYFAVDSYHPVTRNVPESMHMFVKGFYTKNEEEWKIFSAVALTEDPRFLDVSQW
ncbi:MAG: chemotaxis protein CheW [Pseudomonadales bacterium]|uniref:Chemotaxis signal transduction protein CheW n=1 Tax=Oleiphilus messinensis TaxID=141451 RepID=A0A1Y0I1Z6_9GAMM|nr:chemotaxis protein CheW [Oleiphilus messinensis]ARU54421.1 chemotaxis signal transduction protein CheW [Oleiphilus messinensis]MCG8612772.1 chemotaxis protein CheW [Pseudomonadales bacterium]